MTDNANIEFERKADAFYDWCGMLAPGKSEPHQMHGDPSRFEKRLAAWDRFSPIWNATPICLECGAKVDLEPCACIDTTND